MGLQRVQTSELTQSDFRLQTGSTIFFFELDGQRKHQQPSQSRLMYGCMCFFSSVGLISVSRNWSHCCWIYFWPSTRGMALNDEITSTHENMRNGRTRKSTIGYIRWISSRSVNLVPENVTTDLWRTISLQCALLIHLLSRFVACGSFPVGSLGINAANITEHTTKRFDIKMFIS